MKTISAIILSLALVLTTPVAHAGMFKKLIIVSGIAMATKAIAKKHAGKKQQDAQKHQNSQR